MIQNLIQALATLLQRYVTGVTIHQTLINALPSNQPLVLVRFLTNLRGTKVFEKLPDH